LTDVAFKVGIDNPKYFSRIFKEFYGVSPKEYLAKIPGAQMFIYCLLQGLYDTKSGVTIKITPHFYFFYSVALQCTSFFSLPATFAAVNRMVLCKAG